MNKDLGPMRSLEELICFCVKQAQQEMTAGGRQSHESKTWAEAAECAARALAVMTDVHMKHAALRMQAQMEAEEQPMVKPFRGVVRPVN